MKTAIIFSEKTVYGLIRALFVCFAAVLLALSSCQKYDDMKMLEEPDAANLKNASEFCKPGSNDNSGVIYYGHKIFRRSWGSPVVVVQTITNPDYDCFDGKFVLKIRNGHTKFTRVSSGEIWIDGELVVRPSDFSRNVTMITKQLTELARESVLEVKLNGAPGTFIDLWIEGTKKVITPTFEQIGPLCQNSEAPELPLSSTNTPAIKGTWNPKTINTTIVGKTTYTFTPSEGQCGTTTKMEIEVTPQATPAFTQIGPLEQNSVAPALPATSDNGITGTWDPATISTSATGTFTFTFTPAEGQCATVATMVIEVTNTGTISDIEGNVYKTVKIGDQWWMAENLKTTKYNNGDLIGTTSPVTLDISAESAPKYQWAYYGDENNVNKYGRLYTWYTVTDSRGVCPIGWHLPTDAEWTILSNYLTNNGYGFEGSGSDIAKALASKSGWKADLTPGNPGMDMSINNSSGFTAMPAGQRFNYGPSMYQSVLAGWWSSTENSATNGYFRGMYFNGAVLYRYTVIKKDGGSTRCVKD